MNGVFAFQGKLRLDNRNVRLKTDFVNYLETALFTFHIRKSVQI